MDEHGLDFSIPTLGPCGTPSPMSAVRLVGGAERVLFHSSYAELQPWVEHRTEPPAMEVAGPRRTIFFDPARLSCGIVTCGGLCPGLNDVIRSIVLSLHYHYGVTRVYGFRYGYEGLVQRHGHRPL